MADISLTASMRSNLLSLQQTQSLMDTTQERLSTGKKVNSAIDNPSSYYTAQSLTNRASDLSSLLDSMGQAVQTIQAANEGIEAITEFANQAKAIATSANDTSKAADIANYMAQFDEILEQINGIAKDSGYKGVNLLEDGQELKVVFNEDRSSSLTVSGSDASTTGLGLGKSTAWMKKNATITTTAFDAEGTYAVDDYVVLDDKVYKVTAAMDGSGGNPDLTVADFKANAIEMTEYSPTDANKVLEIDKSAINNSITQVEAAVSKLRNMASVFGNNYSIVEGREEFTENLINVLEEGARQQLAINSLSLASQAAQSVLSLF